MTKRPINTSLPINLLRVREHFMQYFRPILKQTGLTEQQWRIIRYVHEYPDSPIEGISSTVCISSPSLTGILNRMEALDLIYRCKNDKDRRSMYIRLTEKGKQTHQIVTALSEKQYEKIEQDVGVKELQVLLGMLEIVNAKFSNAPTKSDT